ncbi:MAG TPA: serine hydrolase [Ferruginibacter sp.]|nr:serine hydrolase [Ferruginibacter sp.]
MSCAAPKKSTTVVATTVPELSKEAVVVENKEDVFFIDLFKKYTGLMDSMLAHRKDWKVQIIYTQINRNATGIPSFTHHYFNRKNENYFYPASTVKFPVALLALEKLNDLNIVGLDKNAAMITEAAYSGQTPVYNDPNTPNGKPTIAQYIKRILLVSDNDAYNRLYEFLGQEHINTALHKKGYKDVQLLHRLSIFLSDDENRHSNPVSFFDNNNRLLYSQPLRYNRNVYAKRNDLLAKAYYSNGKLINEPMNFSTKNNIALADLHQVLLSLVFPQAVSASQRFNLTEQDRQFVLQYMSQLPSESVYPTYDSSYYDAYAKFILFGSEKGSMPKNIRIFNKVGNAYGQLTDVAYIVDFEKKLEFMVSATIYCNSDETLNDDRYDYNTIGFPFMKNLGKILYDYELKRKRNFQPDLSSLNFTYDK